MISCFVEFFPAGVDSVRAVRMCTRPPPTVVERCLERAPPEVHVCKLFSRSFVLSAALRTDVTETGIFESVRGVL